MAATITLLRPPARGFRAAMPVPLPRPGVYHRLKRPNAATQRPSPHSIPATKHPSCQSQYSRRRGLLAPCFAFPAIPFLPSMFATHGSASASTPASAPAPPPPSPPPSPAPGAHGLLPPDLPPDPTVLALQQPAAAALAYLVREVALHVVLPLVALWGMQLWLRHVEDCTRQEVTGGGGGGASPPRGPSSALRDLLDALPGALTAPSRTALAALTATHVARSAANVAQGLAERVLLESGAPMDILVQGGPWRAVSAAKLLLARADAVLLRAYQVLLVVFGCWVALSWKDIALSRFLHRSHDTAQGRQDLERILTPLNTVATWAIVVCGLLLGASAAGVQVAPLLMVTGWGSVLAGLASQQLLANAVSGVQMYMDRPFRVGDTISLVSGVQSYRGEVVEVATLRTHLALEDGSTVAIPNRTLSDMIITNKSRSSRGFNRPPWMESRAPLSLQLHVRLKPASYAATGAALAGLQEAISASGAVEEEGPLAPRAEVTGYSDRGVEIIARCRLKNPSKTAAALATGNLAAALPYGMAGGSADGNGHPGSSSNALGRNGSLSLSNGAGVTLPGLAATTAAPSAVYGRVQSAESVGSPRSPTAVQADKGTDQQQKPHPQQGAGRAAPSPVKAGAPGRSEAVRVLRQQLLLALGPWLQDNNATLTVIE